MEDNYLIEGTKEYEEYEKKKQEALNKEAEESVDNAMENLSEEEIEKLRRQIIGDMSHDRLYSHTKRYISKPIRKKKRKAQKLARRANR